MTLLTMISRYADNRSGEVAADRDNDQARFLRCMAKSEAAWTAIKLEILGLNLAIAGACTEAARRGESGRP